MCNQTNQDTPELTDQEIQAARAAAAAVSPNLRTSFQDRLQKWKATWTRPELLTSSDTNDYTRGAEFEAIIALGPSATPLVLEQIATEPDGFFLLAALERWHNRGDLVATTAEQPLESQQSRSRRALREYATP